MKTAKRALALGIIFFLGAFGGQALAAGKSENAQTIIKPQPTIKGPANNFTGNTVVQYTFPATKWLAASGGVVSFESGTRSFWHTHPAGQTLIVISGEGRTGTWEGKVTEVKTGDVISCPPGVKHWHGASPTSAMSHIAITGVSPDGKYVEWMEEVTDEQYNKDK